MVPGVRTQGARIRPVDPRAEYARTDRAGREAGSHRHPSGPGLVRRPGDQLETEFRVSIFQQLPPGPPIHGVERAIAAGLEILVDFKAFALFSLLFGVGLAIQFDRLAWTGARTVLLVRRLIVLLGFGLIHLTLNRTFRKSAFGGQVNVCFRPIADPCGLVASCAQA
jgi:hypothetical protein